MIMTNPIQKNHPDWSAKRKPIPKSLRPLVHQKYDGHCAYCGKEIDIKDMQVDHIASHFYGGDNSLDNLNPACRACNYYKGMGDIESLRQRLTDMRVCLHRNFDYRLALAYGLITENENRVTFYFEKYNRYCSMD